jgi:hypothetical protein
MNEVCIIVQAKDDPKNLLSTAEIWKDVAGFEGIYMVSNAGRIKRIFNIKNVKPDAKPIKPTLFRNGYLMVTLTFQAKRKHHSSFDGSPKMQ